MIIYDMKEINLTKGMVAIVDDDDFDRLNEFNWYACKCGDLYYARRCYRIKGKNVTTYMHRFILNAKKDDKVDHKNHNTLDNQKNNIRICKEYENRANQSVQKRSSSKYLGVSWSRKESKWIAQIGKNKKNLRIGCFDTEIEAALAYNNKALKLHAEFANPNVI